MCEQDVQVDPVLYALYRAAFAVLPHREVKMAARFAYAVLCIPQGIVGKLVEVQKA